jgi:hypothetical protein
VFHPERVNLQRAGAGSPQHLDTGRHIDQVSMYKYPGVVYQEDGSWVARRRRLQRCKQPKLDTAGMQHQQRSDCSWQTFIFRGHVWRGSVDTTKAVKGTDVSGCKESSAAFYALHPRDCSSDLYGDTGLLPPGVYSLKLCWQHRQNMEAGRWPKEALRFSFEGSRGVGRPKARPVRYQVHYEQIHTLNTPATARKGSTSHA